MVGAHYMSGYKQVAGIMLPTEHRIFARTPEGQVLTEHFRSPHRRSSRPAAGSSTPDRSPPLPHRPRPSPAIGTSEVFDGDGKKVAVATGSAVILPGRPATVTTELTLPQLDESVGDPSGFPSGSGG